MYGQNTLNYFSQLFLMLVWGYVYSDWSPDLFWLTLAKIN